MIKIESQANFQAETLMNWAPDVEKEPPCKMPHMVPTQSGSPVLHVLPQALIGSEISLSRKQVDGNWGEFPL